jgi:acyl-CoA dehydrogenase
MAVPDMALQDGPTEVHLMTIARQLLQGVEPAPGVWPTAWRPAAVSAAQAKHAGSLAEERAFAAGVVGV